MLNSNYLCLAFSSAIIEIQHWRARVWLNMIFACNVHLFSVYRWWRKRTHFSLVSQLGHLPLLDRAFTCIRRCNIMANAPDELFTVKNHFYLGNFQVKNSNNQHINSHVTAVIFPSIDWLSSFVDSLRLCSVCAWNLLLYWPISCYSVPHTKATLSKPAVQQCRPYVTPTCCAHSSPWASTKQW